MGKKALALGVQRAIGKVGVVVYHALVKVWDEDQHV